MRPCLLLVLAALAASAGPVRAEESPIALTAPDSGDYRLLGHLPGYGAGHMAKSPETEVALPGGETTAVAKVRGAKYFIRYATGSGAEAAPAAAVLAAYRTALATKGAQIVDDVASGPHPRLAARFEDAGTLVWVEVTSLDRAYTVVAVEERPYRRAPKLVPADRLLKAIMSAGKIPLDLPFDFEKPSLKPEAQPQIAEIASLLNANPTLRLALDGYTDGIGTVDDNLTLSRARSMSVADALIAAGVSAARLLPRGYGGQYPVGSAATAEGRARSQRIELVKGG